MPVSKTNGAKVMGKLNSIPRQQAAAATQDEMASFERDVQEMKRWFALPRFQDITRLYSPSQVVQQQGTIETDYPIARKAGERKKVEKRGGWW